MNKHNVPCRDARSDTHGLCVFCAMRGAGPGPVAVLASSWLKLGRLLFKSRAPPLQLLCQGLNLLLLLFSTINRGLCDAQAKRGLCNQMAVSRSPRETVYGHLSVIQQCFFSTINTNPHRLWPLKQKKSVDKNKL